MAVMLLSMTVSCLTKEWFILLWLVMLLTDYCLRFYSGVVPIVVAGYIVDDYCFMFDRRVVHIVVVGYIVDHYCFMFERGAVHIAVAGYIVDHCYFIFDRGVVHIVVAVILFPTTISGLTEVWSILLWLVILLIITV